jgi:S-layer homology domain
MPKLVRFRSLLGMSVVGMLFAGFGRGQALSSLNQFPATTLVPEAFGTQDYTVTMISATSFVPADSSQGSHTSGSLGRFGDTNVDEHFYATLDIPAGVVIDYIGLNNLNDGTPGAIGVQIWSRADSGGAPFSTASLSSSPHTNWQTDKNSAPLGVLNAGHYVNGNWWALIVDVEIPSSPNLQFFGWVEVWWKRIVSYPPSVASFNDVPTSHPFFQFIEALKASGITGGCQASPPLYCPDATLTRGQMAVFLAKALGLHWSY